MNDDSTLTLRSADFADGDRMPHHVSAEGDNAVPLLTVDGIPPSTVELALICHDADAPGGGFTHWTVYGLPPSVGEITGTGYREGPTDARTPGWYGPKPPVGHGTHHYTFTLYALSRPVEGEPRRGAFLAGYADAVIEQATLVGTYSR